MTCKLKLNVNHNINGMEIRILIVDSCPAVRFGLGTLLKNTKNFQVVDCVSSLDELPQKLEKLSPNIVIFDLAHNDLNNEQIIKKLSDRYPEIKAIIYTAVEDTHTVYEAIKSGIRGYVSKKSDINYLIKAVSEVNRGEYYLDPIITPKFIRATGFVDKRKDLLFEMTKREIQIMQLVSEGYRNKNIAEALSISQSTVKYHLKSIFSKLSVTSRLEAVIEIKKAGILQDKA